jgi:hypothetical protein
MKIPIFLSSPTQLNKKQKLTREIIVKLLDDLNLEPRALGRSDYPKDYPLKEVYAISKHCYGGIILGFEQCRVTSGMWKPGTNEMKKINKSNTVSFPSPWNQLEAGILFGLKLPLLIFRESKVYGGVFDLGTTEVFVHTMPPPLLTSTKEKELKEIFLKWHAEVGRKYYE